MSARIIDGRAMAADLQASVTAEVQRLSARRALTPGLAVVLVGNDAASETYVRSKTKAVREAGMRSFDHRLSASTSQSELMRLVDELNRDASVHGILVQLPLPAQIEDTKIVAALSPDKDVDGFNPLNIGRLAAGLPGFAPCTPLGCIRLAKSVHPSLAGLEAVVIGRSNVVGRPLVQLLLAENATVTIAHSRTRDPAAVCARADVVFAATGQPETVRKNWIKPGATVIDIGINRVTGPDGKPRLVGDVAFAEVAEVAGAITPVPGGVGPMTIACLLENTLAAAKAAASVSDDGRRTTDNR
jgi:methylenetetrahydrofolate dehydrogenase (NADP+) / methenyltetrahydrofolate cyclohydrolase